MIIKECKISYEPCSKVHVTYEDDSDEQLFTYYSDELAFDSSEIIGLTREQALQLRHDKDVAYLRS